MAFMKKVSSDYSELTGKITKLIGMVFTPKETALTGKLELKCLSGDCSSLSLEKPGIFGPGP